MLSMLRMRVCGCYLFLVSSHLYGAGAPSLIQERVDDSKLTPLPGNTHPLARPEFDRGPAPSSLPMERMLMVVKRSPEREAALEKLLHDQVDALSPNYHHWLTPEQFGQRFGPSDQDITSVTSWLQVHGFQVQRVSSGRTVIEFSGTAGQVEEAFHTAIHKYAVNNQEHWANISDPQIPAALAPLVAGVDSLHNFSKKPMIHMLGVFSRSKSGGEVMAVSPQFTAPINGCGLEVGNCYALGPYDFATIYGVVPLWEAGIDGTGQNIAIVGESSIDLEDVRNFRKLFGLPAKDPVIIVTGNDPGIQRGSGTEQEAAADVEWAGAVARNATIDLVIAQSTNSTEGVDLAAEFIIDRNLAPILSSSYGHCELYLGTTGNQFHKLLWQQAAAQGITVVVASGDSGSAACDENHQAAQLGLAVDGAASTPYNVAVGGTDFNDVTNAASYWSSSNSTVQSSANGYIPETTWNKSCTNGVFSTVLGYSTDAANNCNNPNLSKYDLAIGGGGGKSHCTASNGRIPSSCSGGYPKPAWQTGPGVPEDGARDVPDVSLFAGTGFPSASFYLVCEADGDSDKSHASCDLSSPYLHFVATGGTSLSAQAFGGIMALVDQKSASRQGNINPVLYALAAHQAAADCNSASPANTCVFRDVTMGTIAQPCTRRSPDCVLASVRDLYGVLPGYNAGAGYDLATGLGSVNALRLVNAVAPVSPTFTNTNAASFLAGPLAPDSIVSAFGTGLASAKASAVSLPLPTLLGGVSINVKDSAGQSRAAPLLYVSPTQINYVIPGGTAEGAATITITGGAGTSLNTTLGIVSVAPGVFVSGGLAVGNVVKVDQGVQTVTDTVQNENAAPINVSGTGQVFLVLYGTGVRHHATAVTAKVGTITVTTSYAGPQGKYAGEDQVNILLPKTLQHAGLIDVILTVDGKTTNPARILVQ